MLGDRSIPENFTAMLRFFGEGLFVQLDYSSRTGCINVQVRGEKSEVFLRVLRDELEDYLVQKYKGKEINNRLETIVLKHYDRKKLVYPKSLNRKIDELLLSFRNWRKNRKIKRWGYMLIGPPGSGKTTIGGLLAKERKGCTFLYCPASEIDDMNKLKSIFYWAKLLSPSIIQIDDVDLISQNRRLENSELTRVLMENLDGLEKEGKIFLVFTTNDPSTIDKAISSRPGRISGKIVLDGFGECMTELMALHSSTYALGLSEEAVDRAVMACAAEIKSITPDEVRNICERLAMTGVPNMPIDAARIEQVIKEVYEDFRSGSTNRSYCEEEADDLIL